MNANSSYILSYITDLELVSIASIRFPQKNQLFEIEFGSDFE